MWGCAGVWWGGAGVDFSKFDQEEGSDFPHKKGGIGKIGCRFKNGEGGRYHLFWTKFFSLFSQNLKKGGGAGKQNRGWGGGWVS